jgi:multiple sugar transport system ATP-binding protein
MDVLHGTVSVREGLGSEVIIHVEVDADGVDTEAVRDATEGGGTGHMLVARLPPRTSLHVGDTARLHVDTAQMHLFDLVSGLAIR